MGELTSVQQITKHLRMQWSILFIKSLHCTEYWTKSPVTPVNTKISRQNNSYLYHSSQNHSRCLPYPSVNQSYAILYIYAVCWAQITILAGFVSGKAMRDYHLHSFTTTKIKCSQKPTPLFIPNALTLFKTVLQLINTVTNNFAIFLRSLTISSGL